MLLPDHGVQETLCKDAKTVGSKHGASEHVNKML